jgi:hypothetical protein
MEYTGWCIKVTSPPLVIRAEGREPSVPRRVILQPLHRPACVKRRRALDAVSDVGFIRLSVQPSPGRQCYFTLSLAVICRHCLGICTVMLRSLMSF